MLVKPCVWDPVGERVFGASGVQNGQGSCDISGETDFAWKFRPELSFETATSNFTPVSSTDTMGADHPAFTLAGLCKPTNVTVLVPHRLRLLTRLPNVAVAVGGTMGYVKGGSRPSLIAGVGLGASYGLAGTIPLMFYPPLVLALMVFVRLPP